MADETTETTEQQTQTTEQTAAAEGGTTTTENSQPAKETFVVNGRAVELTPAEAKQWVAYGMAKRQEELAAELEGEGSEEDETEDETTEEVTTPPVTAEEAKENPQLAAILKKQQEIDKKLAKAEAERKADAEAREQAEKDRQWREHVAGLAREFNVAGEDQQVQEWVESGAMKIYQDSIKANNPVDFRTAYKQSRDQVGERLAGGTKQYFKGKVDARETTAEAPGGSGSVAGVTEPTKQRSKEDQMKNAEAYVSGDLDEAAEIMWNKMMNAPSERMAGAR